LLESSGLSVERIAARCGLGTPANLRVHFRRVIGVAPSAYRHAFGVRQG